MNEHPGTQMTETEIMDEIRRQRELYQKAEQDARDARRAEIDAHGRVRRAKRCLTILMLKRAKPETR